MIVLMKFQYCKRTSLAHDAQHRELWSTSTKAASRSWKCLIMQDFITNCGFWGVGRNSTNITVDIGGPSISRSCEHTGAVYQSPFHHVDPVKASLSLNCLAPATGLTCHTPSSCTQHLALLPHDEVGRIFVNRYLQLLSFSLLQVYLLESFQPSLRTLNIEAAGRGTRDTDYYNICVGVFSAIVNRKSSCCVSDRKMPESEASVAEAVTKWDSDFNIVCFMPSVSKAIPSTYYHSCTAAKIFKHRCVPQSTWES